MLSKKEPSIEEPGQEISRWSRIFSSSQLFLPRGNANCLQVPPPTIETLVIVSLRFTTPEWPLQTDLLGMQPEEWRLRGCLFVRPTSVTHACIPIVRKFRSTFVPMATDLDSTRQEIIPLTKKWTSCQNDSSLFAYFSWQDDFYHLPTSGRMHISLNISSINHELSNEDS